MAGSLPVPQKAWQMATVVNTLHSSDPLNQKDLEIQKKNQRVAFGHVVAGSGNGTVGGMGTGDHWNTTADLGGSGFVFSNDPWLVMTQPGSGAQDMLAFTDAGQRNWRFSHSPGGLYTGGSASALPTATDETVLYGFNSFYGRGEGGSNPQFVCNLWISTDLTCCRMSYWFDNNPIGDVMFDAADDPTPGWSHPNYAIVDKDGNGIVANQHVGEVANYCTTSFAGVGIIKGWGPHGALNMYGTVETTNLGSLPAQGTVKNKISGTYRFGDSRSGLWEPIAHADGGFHGRLVDLWWVGAGFFTPGSDLPLDGSKQFVIIGDRMFKWNGSPFRTA